MKVRNLLEEIEELKSSLPKDKKAHLRDKLKGMWSVIERFEKNGEIHKDDRAKIETFKDFIRDFVKNDSV